MAINYKKAKFLWMNGKMVPFEDAVVHMLSPVARYGANVFEGIRVYWNEDEKQLYGFRLKEHYQRLLESTKLMRFNFETTIEACEKIFIELIRKNEFKEDLHARHSIYADGFGPFSATEPVGTFVAAYPRERSFDIENGIRCTVSSWKRIDDNSIPPRIKCGSNYQNSRLSSIQAKEDGYDQPILLNANGKVAEAPGACFFMVRNGVVTTPPVTAGILESVTRATLLELFGKEFGLPVAEREIDRTELYVAQEAFLCGSGAEIVPIVSVDRLRVGDGKPGPVTKQMLTLFFNVVRGKNAAYKHWCTPIYE